MLSLITLPALGPLSCRSRLLTPPGIWVKLNRARLGGRVLSGAITLLLWPWNGDIPLDERLTRGLGLGTCVNLV